VTVIFTTDEYGSTEIHARRVDFDRVDAVVAGLVAKYDVSAKSPHAYQIEHLRALRGAIS
jgi:hypothetical protein